MHTQRTIIAADPVATMMSEYRPASFRHQDYLEINFDLSRTVVPLSGQRSDEQYPQQFRNWCVTQ